MKLHEESDHPFDVASRIADVAHLLSDYCAQVDEQNSRATAGMSVVLLAVADSADYVRRSIDQKYDLP